MAQLTFFDNDDRPAQAARLAPRLRALAGEGTYFGGSSWKYEGWLGSIYTPGRYTVRGKLSQRKFEAECLAEYAEVFPAVCGDFSFYQFPTADYWRQLFGETPDSLQFAFKVPEEITVAVWPAHPRYGPRGGRPNASFLDVRRFAREFAGPLEAYGDRVAALIFEFGTIPQSVLPADEVVDRLDAFLGALPEGFRFAVEVRNPEYLGPRYFAALASHGVAHVLNAWTRMPDLATQAALPGAFTADFTVVRALLRPGRTYPQAVTLFEPYRAAQEADTPTREALRQIAERSRQAGKPAFIFVNNRLEGHAPTTIEAVVNALDRGRGAHALAAVPRAPEGPPICTLPLAERTDNPV